MVTRQPRKSNNSSSWGMAVISLDLAYVLPGPKVSRLAEAQALTKCSGRRPEPRSPLPRRVLPSMATTSPWVSSLIDGAPSRKPA